MGIGDGGGNNEGVLNGNDGTDGKVDKPSDKEDLGVDDNQAAPGSGAEAGPDIGDGGVALAADDGGLDLAGKGAIKGDDGVLAVG